MVGTLLEMAGEKVQLSQLIVVIEAHNVLVVEFDPNSVSVVDFSPFLCELRDSPPVVL